MEGAVEKQAVIVSYTKNDALNFALGYLGTLLFAFGSQMGGKATEIGYFIASALACRFGFFVLEKYVEPAIAYIRLKRAGFSVTLHRDVKSMEKFFSNLKDNATSATTTVFCYLGHGWITKSGKSHISMVEDNKTSYVFDGYLISRLARVPGSKIAAIRACAAGGFADKADDVLGREKLLVFTASDKAEARLDDPFTFIFLNSIRNASKGKESV